MQGAIAEQPSATVRRRAQSNNDLVSLASPILELALKLRTGLIPSSNDVRPVVSDLFNQMDQGSAALSYSEGQTQAAKFALAAFVDETVLTIDFPLRDEWEKYPLQLQYFGEHLAGVKFFERLDSLLKNIEENGDVIEVYYMCLLLGYKGKYKIYLEDQLKGVTQNIADQLRRVNRLKAGALSPHGVATDQIELPRDPGLPLWIKIGGPTALGLVLVIYTLLYFLLQRDLNVIR